jgi:hypothetical protein
MNLIETRSSAVQKTAQKGYSLAKESLQSKKR